MARYLIALAGIAVVGIGLYLFLAVHDDPAPVAKVAPAARPLAERPHARPAQLLGDEGTPTRPSLPADQAAAPSPPRTPEEAAEKREEAKSEVVAQMHARPGFKLNPKPNPRVERYARDAQDAFDQGDVPKAKAIATKLLARFPGNPQMLHLLAAAGCADKNAAEAQKYYGQMTPADRAKMKKECSVPLTDPAP